MASARKRSPATLAVDAGSEAPAPKRRSSRQAAAAATTAIASVDASSDDDSGPSGNANNSGRVRNRGRDGARPARKTTAPPPAAETKPARSRARPQPKAPRSAAEASKGDARDDDIPAVNPEAPRHDGEWYWLMKAEPETRLENGVDVSFSIDDLRAKTRPEGWDGIRAYAARNHMRTMNVGDKAFFYHSNCKDPGIAGIMEIVKEFSPDKSALVPGAPYYDAASTEEKLRWSLVHVEFRRKFAVPVSLREMRELGKPGGALEDMQMLKQSRLSVSRVSAREWAALCRLADDKAAEAGLAHDDGPRRGE